MFKSNYNNNNNLLGVKCVKQSHQCSALNDLMVEFRYMVNEAIRIGIEKNITSKFSLRNEVYYRFKNQFNTCYINMAVFHAHTLIKNYRRLMKDYRKLVVKKPDTKIPNIPRVKPDKQFLIIDSCVYKIIHDHIQIP